MRREKEPPSSDQRRHWMRVMAVSPSEALEKAFGQLGWKPAYRFLRRPESGGIMLRGRIGGTGNAFNMGEATVTRCTVLLDDGPAGTAYVLGRDLRKAELVAVCDALLQDQRYHQKTMQMIIQPLEAENQKRINQSSRQIAATKVNFFTMTRGE